MEFKLIIRVTFYELIKFESLNIFEFKLLQIEFKVTCQSQTNLELNFV